MLAAFLEPLVSSTAIQFSRWANMYEDPSSCSSVSKGYLLYHGDTYCDDNAGVRYSIAIWCLCGKSRPLEQHQMTSLKNFSYLLPGQLILTRRMLFFQSTSRRSERASVYCHYQKKMKLQKKKLPI